MHQPDRHDSRTPGAVPRLRNRAGDDRGFLTWIRKNHPLTPLDDTDIEDWQLRERVPVWYIHSIEVDGEEFAASAGNGVTMTEVTIATDT